MYINKIHIQNYRNFVDFTMEFHKGLNVIIGANNSGKTGLLYAINLLNSPSDISVDDFNKNNLMQYSRWYLETAPSITIEYNISHRICEDNTDDESIIRLLPFLGIKGFVANRQEHDGVIEYNIAAQIKAVYSLDAKFLEEYKKAVSKEAKDFETYLLVLKRFVANYYSWNYTNGISDTKADQKAVTDVFDIRFIGAERTSEEVRKETKREIISFTKDADNAANFDKFQHDVSEGIEKLLAPSITKLATLFENEKNAIGLAKGNVSIASTVHANFSLADAYSTEVKDTKNGYTLPLQYNGLGYNNLINICITDKDFEWIDFDGDGNLRSYSEYANDEPTHITDLKKRFPIENFYICTQSIGGRTFEDEFFLANMVDKTTATTVFKRVISDTLNEFFDKYGFDLTAWESHIEEMDGRSRKTIKKFLDAYKYRADTSAERTSNYENLIFAEIFLHYAKDKKGDVALGILTDETLLNEDGSSKLVVPRYIQEGLTWLLK